MKNGKEAGKNNFLSDMLKESDMKTRPELVKLFNECLTEEHINVEKYGECCSCSDLQEW